MLLQLKEVFQNDGHRLSLDYSLPMQEVELNGDYPFKSPVQLSVEAVNRAGLVKLTIVAEFIFSTHCDRCFDEIEKSESDMMKIIPDERQRLMASYCSLKVNSKDLTKQKILDSIDHYISILNKWQEEAIAGLNAERNKVSDKKQEMDKLREQMAAIQNKIDELNKDVLATESKCNQNEADMKTSVGFLVNKLTEDKNKISTILTD